MKSDREIKRVLGIGTATMSDHLRRYKDPFEPAEPEWELEPRKAAKRLQRAGMSAPSMVRSKITDTLPAG